MNPTLPVRQPDVAEHPTWCAQGHRCGLGEHRATPVTVQTPGRGVVVLTRVQDAGGRQHVEVRTRIVLADGDEAARVHLARIVWELHAHLRRVTVLRR
jgi:hypothetical protein